MRNLTICRKKSFVACLGKMKVYIEDADSAEMIINGVNCRKLGDLKNGEEKTFEIGDGAAKIFVIADKLSKGYCADMYKIPEGAEDVYLAGKNRYNPFKGNPFYFDDNNSDPEVAELRKKGSKKGIIIFALAVVVGILVGRAIVGFLLSDPHAAETEKVFSDAGMSITLTDRFEEQDAEGVTVCYATNEVALFMIKEGFFFYEGLENYTLEEYSDMCASTAPAEVTELGTVDGMRCFEYTYNSDGNTYYYFVTTHKRSDAFWIIQFSTLEKNADKYKDDFIKWAKSVEFEK